MVQLAERAREGRLAALVGAGDDEDSLVPRTGAESLRTTESPARRACARGEGRSLSCAIDVLVCRQRRVAERQPGSPERLDVGLVGEVELDLALERGDRGVGEAAPLLPSSAGKVVEYVLVQSCDVLEDRRLDVAHLEQRGKAHAVVLDRSLAKTVKDGLDFMGCSPARRIAARDLDPVALDRQLVGDLVQAGLQVGRGASESDKRFAGDIAVEVGREMARSPGDRGLAWASPSASTRAAWQYAETAWTARPRAGVGDRACGSVCGGARMVRISDTNPIHARGDLRSSSRSRMTSWRQATWAASRSGAWKCALRSYDS